MSISNKAPLETFPPNQLQDAVSLAAELYRRDRERQAAIDATAEVGVPPEYLARAMAAILERNAERQAGAQSQRATLRNIITGVLAVGALVAIVWPFALWWQPPPPPTLALPAATSRPAVAAPPTIPGSQPVTLNPLPIPEGPLSFRNLEQVWRTSIEFQNTLNHPVDVYGVDFFNKRQHAGRIPPGGSMQKRSYTSTSWLVFDDQKKPVGMFFTMRGPTTARITATPEMPTATKAEGYLQPTTVGALPAESSLPKPSTTVPGIEFVNFTGKEVQLYTVGPTKKATWITTLSRYDNYINADSQEGTLWVVTDTNRRVLETFVQPERFRIALITPDVVP